MRSFLLISSILFISACNTNPYKSLNVINNISPTRIDLENPFSSGKSLLFKTKVNIYKHYLSGLLVIKQKNESKRVIFTSEVGMKFFDFEFTPDTFIVHHCIEQLNKKAVLKTLEEDLGLTILHNVNNKEYDVVQVNPFVYRRIKEDEYFYFETVGKKLKKIEKTTNKKSKVVVTFEQYDADVPEIILIHHNDIKLDIELNYIKR